MAEKKNLLTREGLRKLEDELQDLKVNRRQEIAQKIKEAREQGDLSENAEYDAAKDEQRDIEARIEEIEKILKYAEVADEEEVEQGVVNFGSEVSILDIDMDEVNTFKIVGSTESNILEGKLFWIFDKKERVKKWQRISSRIQTGCCRCVATSSQSCRQQEKIHLRLRNMM